MISPGVALAFALLGASLAAAAPPSNSIWIVDKAPAEGEDVVSAFAKLSLPFPAGPLLEGEVLLHLDYATVDASNRLWISKNFKQTAKEQGLEAFLTLAKEDSNPMITYGAVMTVIDSNDPGYAKGDIVVGMTVLQEYLVLKPALVGLTKVQPQAGMPNSYFLGPLGLSTGVTALLAVQNTEMRYQNGDGNTPSKRLEAGDKVYVSAGSGAVGMMAIQIYKSMGADVIVSTGSDEKVEFLKEKLEIEAFNYKNVDVFTALSDFAPEGLAYYFDNVGGATLDAAIKAMAPFGNIVECGMVSAYGKASPGIHNLMQVVTKSLSIRGFLVNQWGAQFQDAAATLGELVQRGEIKFKEDRFSWDEYPQALSGLLAGSKFGKTIVVGSSIPADIHDEL